MTNEEAELYTAIDVYNKVFDTSVAKMYSEALITLNRAQTFEGFKEILEPYRIGNHLVAYYIHPKKKIQFTEKGVEIRQEGWDGKIVRYNDEAKEISTHYLCRSLCNETKEGIKAGLDSIIERDYKEQFK